MSIVAPRYLCENEDKQKSWIKTLATTAANHVEQPIGAAGLRLQASRWARLQVDRVHVLAEFPITEQAPMVPFAYDLDSDDVGLPIG